MKTQQSTIYGEASGKDGSIGRHGSPLHTTTSETTNQVEWKSDKYGIKETTSIQTGRRGTDVEWAGLLNTCAA